MGFFARLIAQVAQILLPWLVTGFMKWLQKREEKMADEKQIDENLQKLKDAIVKSQDGTPMTPEQSKEVRDALRTVIRG